MERLKAFTSPPTAVVASGSPNCAHAWWSLNRPLPPGHARLALRRLTHALGADMRSAEPARILRLPGTVSHKHDPPAPVTCTQLELDSYHVKQLVGHLPDPPGPCPASPGPGISSPARGAADPLLAIPASEYLPALTGRELGADGKLRCPVHSGGRERTPSLHAYADPDKGWWCYGCQRGGSIIDLGALLYAIEPRGRGYHEIRRRLAAELLPHLRETA